MKSDVLVVAGMIERKFRSKVEPLCRSPRVGRIFVVRRKPVELDRCVCYAPSGMWASNVLAAELYRIAAVLYVLVRYRPGTVVGIGLIMHGIYTNVLGTLFRRRKVVLLMGKNDLALTDPRRKKLQKLLMGVVRLSDYVGTRGTRSAAMLRSAGIPGDRVFIPHNVFSFDDFPHRPSPPEYDLAYVGLLAPYKRMDWWIDAVALLVHTHGHAGLRAAIMGDGPLLGRLLEHARARRVETNIRFLPRGGVDKLVRLLNATRVFMMTSRGEGLPMAAVEALSCGVPVAAFDDADIGDVVHDGRNGVLCRLGDVDALAAAVHRVLADGRLRARLSEGALALRAEMEDAYSSAGLDRIWEPVLTALCGEA